MPEEDHEMVTTTAAIEATRHLTEDDVSFSCHLNDSLIGTTSLWHASPENAAS